MADTTNIKIGSCSVFLGGVDLGHTKGGVTFSYSPEYTDITADKYGNTPIDKVLTGEILTVTVPLAEPQVARIKEIIPLSTEVGTNGRATIGKVAGSRLLAQAAQLVLHPLNNAANVLTEDIVLHKAVVHGEVSMNFEVDNERVVEVEFIALIDTTKSDGNLLGFVGDSTAS
jgi:hypothetical protein